jgi:hypothetical protein
MKLINIGTRVDRYDANTGKLDLIDYLPISYIVRKAGDRLSDMIDPISREFIHAQYYRGAAERLANMADVFVISAAIGALATKHLIKKNE